ncbi:MAG: 3D domain-containing protein [Candidatus Merdivicinus sp.]|jgi:3D (Asp-Asp-Asp) domain-containing protein
MLSKRMKLVTVTLSAILAAPSLMGAVTYRNAIRILDDGKHPDMILSESNDPQTILKEAEITLGEYDKIKFTETGNRVYLLEIDRAFDVAFDNGGTLTTVPMLENETVADLLQRAGVSLGEEDIITPALTEVVTPETTVTLQRITYETHIASETIPYETIEQHTPLLKDGKTRQLEEGSNGSQTRTTVNKYINGVYQETISETVEVTKAAVNEVVLYGDSSATVTTLEVPADLQLDSNGNPVNYSKKITGKGTAYSAWDGAKTASGRYAIPGHVAVNPNVIPYGSKLYIKSSDGKFVYGYAIAADTGIALMDGRVTVDLYFDTYLESCLFGAKTMDIYVLE